MLLTPRFVLVLLVGALLIGLSGWFGPLFLVGSLVTAGACVGALIDLRQTSIGKAIEVTRECDDKLSLGAKNVVRLLIRNPSFTTVNILIRDEYPDGFECDGNNGLLSLPARSEGSFCYHVTPYVRGDYEFGDVYLRITGSLGLATRQIRLPMRREVKVYPNLLDMHRLEIGLRRRQAVQQGQHVVRIHGRGTDFESLREYLPDDEFRAIDWKASARRGKLVTRQYQEEKAQNVLIVLDCGRVMGPVIRGLTRLDHSINAAMMLANVAAVKGDRVGLLAFGEDIIAYSPPKPGRGQTLALLSLAYNLRQATGDSNYYHAIPYLARRWTRRSLIAFFTDIVDPESSKPLITQITSLTKKHLCICVTMLDPALPEARNRLSDDPEQVFTAAAAAQAMQARKLAAAQLVRAGAIVVDVSPEQLTPALVNHYLEIKATGRL